MADDWIILELSPKADNEDPEIVRASIRHLIRDADVFVPASIVQRGEDRVVHYLVEGYAFIRRERSDDRYFRLEGSKYVQRIVTSTRNKMRYVQCVTAADIQKFRSQLKVEEDQGIDVEDLILITSGPYKNLKAVVIENIPEQDAVQVHVELRSKSSIITLPRAFLRLVEKKVKAPFQDRKEALDRWIHAAIQLAQWEPSVDFALVFQSWLQFERVFSLSRQVTMLTAEYETSSLEEKARKLEKLEGWYQDVSVRYTSLTHFAQTLSAGALVETRAQYERLTRWADRANSLASVLHPLYASTASAALECKFLEWHLVEEFDQRMSTTLTQIERLEKQMASGGIQNLIIDGHNLAIRCASAPGLGELKSNGRPTGAIVGFLNTLGTLRKRFAGADIYVTWDYSSDTRKRMFSGYKQNRGSAHAKMFEITWLQEYLPSLGIYQAWNPAEEADDVIAALVRHQLDGQLNLIYTTDRDMLQLVSDTTQVLVPAVGGGKEKHYTSELVVREYGVVPEDMPQLRALSGDTSDTIPGCPNCGLKTAGKLLALYGTLEKLFASNMAGLAKGLTSNLRASEKQVRLNVELMTLRTDIPLTMLNPDADESRVHAALQDIEVKTDRLLPIFFGAQAT